MFFNFLSSLAVHIGLAGCGFMIFLIAGSASLAGWIRILIIVAATLLSFFLYFVTGITFEKGESTRKKALSAWPLSAVLLLLSVLSQVFGWVFFNEGLFLNAPFLPLWLLLDRFGLSVAQSSWLLSLLPSFFIWLGVRCQKTPLYQWFRR